MAATANGPPTTAPVKLRRPPNYKHCQGQEGHVETKDPLT